MGNNANGSSEKQREGERRRQSHERILFVFVLILYISFSPSRVCSTNGTENIMIHRLRYRDDKRSNNRLSSLHRCNRLLLRCSTLRPLRCQNARATNSRLKLIRTLVVSKHRSSVCRLKRFSGVTLFIDRVNCKLSVRYYT